MSRLHRLAQGDLGLLVNALMAHARTPCKPASGERSQQEIDTAVVELLGVRGGKQRAAQLLSPARVATPDEDCFRQLLSKYPPPLQGESVQELQDAARNANATVTALPEAFAELQRNSFAAEQLIACIQHASPFAGAGPSGFRYAHLQQALDTRWGREHLPSTLQRLCRLLHHKPDSLPPLFWQLHSLARLTPLAERLPDGSMKIRPVACGETLQRLCASVYTREHRDVLAQSLAPHGQHGVAVSAGGELCAMLSRMEYEAGHWTLALDMRNAFNTVSLKAVLHYVRTELPDVLGYFLHTYIYTQPVLLFRDQEGFVRSITSYRGVKQGDPLGPVLFCGAISGCLRRFNEHATLQRQPQRLGAYMDDAQARLGCATLEQRHVNSILGLKQDLHTVGLDLNLIKSSALPGKGHLVTTEELQLLAELRVQLAGGINEDERRGMVVLGAPVGNPEYARQWLTTLIGPESEAVKLALSCARLSSPRAMYQLLRYCIVPKLSYTLRTVPPDLTASAAAHWDTLMTWLLERSMGLQPADKPWQQFLQEGAHLVLEGVAQDQSQLPVRLGGLGVTSAVKTAAAAYVASSAATIPQALAFWAQASEDNQQRLEHPGGFDLPLLQAWAAATLAVRDELGVDFPSELLPPTLLANCQAAATSQPAQWQGLLHEGPVFGAQSKLSRALASKHAQEVLAAVNDITDAKIRKQHLARVKSQRQEGSLGLAFLGEPIYANNKAFDGLAWQLALRRSLGVERSTARCSHCKKPEGGTLHARTCRASGITGYFTTAHNRFARAVAQAAQDHLGITPHLESHAPFLSSAHPEYHIDVALPAGAFPTASLSTPGLEKAVLVDASLLEVQCDTLLNKAASDPVDCCRRRERDKDEHYGEHYDQTCYNLITMAVGSFGCIGEQGAKFISALAQESAARHGLDRQLRGVCAARIRGALSLALHWALSDRVTAYMAAPANDWMLLEAQAQLDANE